MCPLDMSAGHPSPEVSPSLSSILRAAPPLSPTNAFPSAGALGWLLPSPALLSKPGHPVCSVPHQPQAGPLPSSVCPPPTPVQSPMQGSHNTLMVDSVWPQGRLTPGLALGAVPCVQPSFCYSNPACLVLTPGQCQDAWGSGTGWKETHGARTAEQL